MSLCVIKMVQSGTAPVNFMVFDLFEEMNALLAIAVVW